MPLLRIVMRLLKLNEPPLIVRSKLSLLKLTNPAILIMPVSPVRPMVRESNPSINCSSVVLKSKLGDSLFPPISMDWVFVAG